MFTFFRQAFRSRLSRGAAVTFGIRVAGAGLLYALHVLLARWMGTEGYGVYVFAISWTSFLAELGALGIPNAALRFVPTYRSDGRVRDLWAFLRTGRVSVFAATAGLSALATGGVLVLPASGFSTEALILGFWLAPLLALVAFETQVLRASNRFALSYAPNQVLRPLGIGAGAAGLLWLTGSVSPIGVLLCTALIFLGALIVQQRGTRGTLPVAPGTLFPPRARRWLGVALPLLLTSGFHLVVKKTDIFLIGAVLGAEEVGIYFAAMRTAQVVTFVGFAVEAVAGPLIARLYHDEDDALQSTVSRLAHWYFWPTLAGAGGLVVFGGPILSLFGTAFTSGWPVMCAFLAGLLANAATGPQTHLLSLTGHERSCAYIFGWCAALNVVLNLVGLSVYGTLGAALATAATLAVRNLWVRHRVVQLTGIRPSIVSALRPTAPSHA